MDWVGRGLPFTYSLPTWLQWLELGQVKTRSPTLSPGLTIGQQGPTRALFCCFPKCIRRELLGKCSGWKPKWRSDRGCLFLMLISMGSVLMWNKWWWLALSYATYTAGLVILGKSGSIRSRGTQENCITAQWKYMLWFLWVTGHEIFMDRAVDNLVFYARH